MGTQNHSEDTGLSVQSSGPVYCCEVCSPLKFQLFKDPS